PVPGGPQNTIEPTVPRSIASRSGLPGASRCRWPTISSSVRGRMRAASGCVTRGAKSDAVPRSLSPSSAFFFFRSLIISVLHRCKAAGNEIQTAARDEAERDAPTGAVLEFRYQVRRGDVQRHARGDGKPVGSKKLEAVRDEQACYCRNAERSRRHHSAPA